MWHIWHVKYKLYLKLKLAKHTLILAFVSPYTCSYFTKQKYYVLLDDNSGRKLTIAHQVMPIPDTIFPTCFAIVPSLILVTC